MTTTASAAPATRPAPVGRLTVLHDPGCLLCRHLTAWLRGQAQLVPLEFVAVNSAEAHRLFPGLDHDASLGEITVVGDTGEVWRGAPAFVVCLWALAEHRPLAHRLSTPAGLPLARAAAFAASKYRQATGAGRAPALGVQGSPSAVQPGPSPAAIPYAGGRHGIAAPDPANPYGAPPAGGPGAGGPHTGGPYGNGPYGGGPHTGGPYGGGPYTAGPYDPAAYGVPPEPGCGDGSCSVSP
ncbi:thiol-disulfide oxidoreductase DCC family protein [Kitasatospora terrestris]|uniref:DUF393 domain-containing protein n=1 Tax=Kitasatospora terrestris TaxID=258051 RepID=A0ABP9DQ71_9ACTN